MKAYLVKFYYRDESIEETNVKGGGDGEFIEVEVMTEEQIKDNERLLSNFKILEKKELPVYSILLSENDELVEGVEINELDNYTCEFGSYRIIEVAGLPIRRHIEYDIRFKPSDIKENFVDVWEAVDEDKERWNEIVRQKFQNK